MRLKMYFTTWIMINMDAIQKKLNIIKEMINKYPVKHKIKDFLLKKVSF